MSLFARSASITPIHSTLKNPHTEAANISSHKDRLHDNKHFVTEQKVGDDDDNGASDQ